MKPLKDILILDLTRVLAGPWATQLLADMGARVIKIEQPQQGDDTRHWGPPYLSTSKEYQQQLSAYYLSANRGKESLALDIRSSQGQQIIRQLVQKTDVLIENFKQGGLAKYQLDHKNLSQLNPRLVYCSITGFGQTGPDKHKPGYDAMIQSMGGLMSITGESPQQPQKTGVAISDLMTGMYASNAILAALHQVKQSGVGCHIDVSLLDSQIAWLANQGMNYLVSGQIPQAMGNAHPSIVPYQTFATADDHLTIAVGNDSQFQHFCQALEQPQWQQQAEYQTNSLRLQHRHELVTRIQSVLSQKSSEHWLQVLQQAGVPCARVNNIQQAFDLPQVQHRQMQQQLSHPEYGETPSISSPLFFDQQKAMASQAPPLRGEHSHKLLSEFCQLSDEQIQQLQQANIVE